MTTSAMTPVALGLGANLGECVEAIHRAVARLARGGVEQLRLSALYETDPVNCFPGTPPFVNAAVIGEWAGTPDALLDLCQRIERQMGRPQLHSSHAARVIDVDVLLFGAQVIRAANLIVPHPRLADRMFALMPLADVAATWEVPPAGRTVADLCASLRACTPAGSGVRRL